MKVPPSFFKGENITDIHIVAQVLGGVLEKVLTFSTKEKALAWIIKQTKNTDFRKVSTDQWSSRDNDEILTLLKAKIQ